MAKFSIGDKVIYKGNNSTLCKYFDKPMEVVDIVPSGIAIGNGEVNKSGQNLYRLMCFGILMNFLESELDLA